MGVQVFVWAGKQWWKQLAQMSNMPGQGLSLLVQGTGRPGPGQSHLAWIPLICLPRWGRSVFALACFPGMHGLPEWWGQVKALNVKAWSGWPAVTVCLEEYSGINHKGIRNKNI